jgi:hypothetical protein
MLLLPAGVQEHSIWYETMAKAVHFGKKARAVLKMTSGKA